MNPALPDIIDSNLKVLFCGINPGVQAAASGHHFEGRNNRFWQVLHRAGFTAELLSPQDDHRLLAQGCGLTTVIQRPTASAAVLSRGEFIAATQGFERKLAHYRPRVVAFLGKVGYAGMRGVRHVDWGLQQDRLRGAVVWVLPNPSGRNRSFALDRLVGAYRELYLHLSERG